MMMMMMIIIIIGDRNFTQKEAEKKPKAKFNSQDATNKTPRLSIYLFRQNALHVSGSSSAHHQELKLYIQLLVFVKPCCYLLLSWLGWNW
jgi:hypothetical protein